MLKSLEMHVLFPQIGLALHDIVNDGKENFFEISPLGNTHDMRRISEGDFLRSYGNALKERLDEIELLHFQADDARLTPDLCASLVRLGMRTEVIAAVRATDSPMKALRTIIERDRQRLAAGVENKENGGPEIARGSLGPAEADYNDVEIIRNMLRQFEDYQGLSRTVRRREDPAFRILWPIQRVGQAFLARRFQEAELIGRAEDLVLRFSNCDASSSENPPYFGARKGGITLFELPLAIDDWRLQLFLFGMKDKRSWVKRTATRGLEMPAVSAMARIADDALIAEAERIAEFRARQAAQVEEEPDVIDVIDEAPRNEFVVGIGSEGCVFGTLELQIKECFIPNFINGYRLQEISKFARQAAEFVNLYSKHRGVNRYAALVEQLRLLRLVPEVRARGIKVPVPIGLTKWLEQTPSASNRALEQAAAASSDPDLELALKWSKAVNKTISQVDHGVPPYPYARETLKKLAGFADVMVVSNMPNKLLTKEWQQHELAGYVKAICGREAGGKAESMSIAANFPEHHALMVGDSYFDLAAARATNCLFFPINPGAEEASWRRLYEEGVDRFLTETFVGAYQDALLADFERHLPAHPSWLPPAETPNG